MQIIIAAMPANVVRARDEFASFGGHVGCYYKYFYIYGDVHLNIILDKFGLVMLK